MWVPLRVGENMLEMARAGESVQDGLGKDVCCHAEDA